MDCSNFIDNIKWNKHGLIPAIAQDFKSNKILMLAYVSRESLRLSLESGIVHYFSRSKNRIWKKGEESGNIQVIKEIYIDCDGDAILFIIEQVGSACHTGNYSCFFKKLDSYFKLIDIDNVVTKPTYSVIDDLYHIIESRKFASKDTSYTALMFSKGENAICKKIIEEAGELTFALKDKDENNIIYECSDLIYHILLGLCNVNISPDRVMQELKRRFYQSGIQEKNSRKQ